VTRDDALGAARGGGAGQVPFAAAIGVPTVGAGITVALVAWVTVAVGLAAGVAEGDTTGVAGARRRCEERQAFVA